MRRPWYRGYLPGWIVTGAGGGGGLSSVTRDNTLVGAGTVPSPLGMARSTYWAPLLPRSVLTGSGTITQNTLFIAAYLIPCAVTFGHFAFRVTTQDNSANVYDLGLYNAAGTLVANVGATAGSTFCPNIADQTLAVNASFTPPVTIPPGVYYFAYTSSAAAPALVTLALQTTTFYANTSFGTSTGGACPNSITPQTFQGFNVNIVAPLVALVT